MQQAKYFEWTRMRTCHDRSHEEAAAEKGALNETQHDKRSLHS